MEPSLEQYHPGRVTHQDQLSVRHDSKPRMWSTFYRPAAGPRVTHRRERHLELVRQPFGVYATLRSRYQYSDPLRSVDGFRCLGWTDAGAGTGLPPPGLLTLSGHPVDRAFP